jgi:nucleotide-binding universal stress UspA family protein
LVIGWTGRAVAPARGRAGSVARAAARQATASVLVLQRDLAEAGPVMLLHDGGESAERALAVAMTLAKRDGGEVAVLLLVETPRQAMALEQAIEARLAEAGLAGRFQMLPNANVGLIRRAVGLVPGGVLVAGADMPALAQGGAESLLDELGCSVVLVR